MDNTKRSKKTKPSKQTKDDSSEFRVATGKAAVRTSVYHKKSSNVIIEEASLQGYPGLSTWIARYRFPMTFAMAFVLTALISFMIGRLTAPVAYADMPDTANVYPVDQETFKQATITPEVLPEPLIEAQPEATETIEPSDDITVTEVSDLPVESTQDATDIADTEFVDPVELVLDEPILTLEELHKPAIQGQYTIQVRAYKSTDDVSAGIMAGRLRQQGLSPVFTIRNRRNHILVCLGAFDARSDTNINDMSQEVSKILERTVDGIIRMK